MARDFVALVGVHADDVGIVLECSVGLFLLGMVIMSLTNISMIIFSCTHDDTPRTSYLLPSPPTKKHGELSCNENWGLDVWCEYCGGDNGVGGGGGGGGCWSIGGWHERWR